MISQSVSPLKSGDRLSLGLVNRMIGRIEYAASILKSSKTLAGDGITLTETPEGTVVSSAFGAQPPSYRRGGTNPRFPMNPGNFFNYYRAGAGSFVRIPGADGTSITVIYLDFPMGSNAKDISVISPCNFIMRLSNGVGIYATPHPEGFAMGASAASQLFWTVASIEVGPCIGDAEPGLRAVSSDFP